MNRAILIVLDGCGAGEAPDAAQFGDRDHPATVRHVFEKFPFEAPNLRRIGFLAACQITSQEPGQEALYGRLEELSQGKDSVTGHWEMMGVDTAVPFPTFPDGFPEQLIQSFESAIGRKSLGNYASSGTAILDQLGPEHIATGLPIVYTSADSVFQIAAHESVVPLPLLYEWCEAARTVCVDPFNLQRVIARPFIGEPGSFQRTGGRRDFPMAPPHNFVDVVGDVLGIGVVPELFAHRGFRAAQRTTSNAEHEAALLEALQSDARFIFANFEDFDMLYGHRNDPDGFSKALARFDFTLGKVIDQLQAGDLLLLTADHGNDPTSVSTDHSREYVPIAIMGSARQGDLGDVPFMGSIAQTIATHLGVDYSNNLGTSLI